MNLFFSKFFGTREGQVRVGWLVHDEASQRDGVLHGGDAGNGAAPATFSVHDAGFHLHRTFLRQRRSTAGIEEWVSFQFSHLQNHKTHFTFFTIKIYYMVGI